MIKRIFFVFLAALILSASARALDLEGIRAGNIGLYEDIQCTREVTAPVESRIVSSGRTYYIKEESSGRVFSGTTCYIYANAVYNTLFGDVPYHGESDTWTRSSKLHGPAQSVSYEEFISWGVEAGSLLRTTANEDGSYNGSYGHSLIILDYDSGGVTYLEGNGDGNGLIRIMTRDWADFNRFFLTRKGYIVSFIVGPRETELIGYFRKLRDFEGFTDVKVGAWYYSEVKSAYELGLIAGIGGGKFSPDGTLTKAQAVTLAARLLSLYWADGNEFTGGKAWYEPYYAYLEDWGVYLDRSEAGEEITRGELAELLYRALPKNELNAIKEYGGFSDTEATAAITALTEAGIIEGENGLFRPDDTLRRSEAAAIITRFADRAKRVV